MAKSAAALGLTATVAEEQWTLISPRRNKKITTIASPASMATDEVANPNNNNNNNNIGTMAKANAYADCPANATAIELKAADMDAVLDADTVLDVEGPSNNNNNNGTMQTCRSNTAAAANPDTVLEATAVAIALAEARDATAI